MHKVNELFGKQVINQSNGEKVAAVRDIVLSADAQRIVALVVGGGGFSSDEQIIRWDRITSIGDYVIVENIEPFLGLDEDAEIGGLRKEAHQITGKNVITTAGERIGTVGDMFFDPSGQITGYEIKQGGLFSSNPILPAQNVQAVGKDAVIASSADLVDRAAFDETAISTVERAVGDTHADVPRMVVPNTAAKETEEIPPYLDEEPIPPLPETRRDLP